MTARKSQMNTKTFWGRRYYTFLSQIEAESAVLTDLEKLEVKHVSTTEPLPEAHGILTERARRLLEMLAPWRKELYATATSRTAAYDPGPS